MAFKPLPAKAAQAHKAAQGDRPNMALKQLPACLPKQIPRILRCNTPTKLHNLKSLQIRNSIPKLQEHRKCRGRQRLVTEPPLFTLKNRNATSILSPPRSKTGPEGTGRIWQFLPRRRRGLFLKAAHGIYHENMS